ncbi:hypothetical protein [Paenibacillus ginsengarvi]|uniref:Uncharacterized protein n=1 Tax=Paenibacillus ginsengarvi TaxID=400777 RepID=A0A3B0ARK5_9BACL|nr:hypothetical protein [Paenibacillus ginsengarvi]RKN61987.1 hypothetical protein D7M11_35065 [Paenibacillus ginsengarvi]
MTDEQNIFKSRTLLIQNRHIAGDFINQECLQVPRFMLSVFILKGEPAYLQLNIGLAPEGCLMTKTVKFKMDPGKDGNCYPH